LLVESFWFRISGLKVLVESARFRSVPASEDCPPRKLVGTVKDEAFELRVAGVWFRPGLIGSEDCPPENLSELLRMRLWSLGLRVHVCAKKNSTDKTVKANFWPWITDQERSLCFSKLFPVRSTAEASLGRRTWQISHPLSVCPSLSLTLSLSLSLARSFFLFLPLSLSLSLSLPPSLPPSLSPLSTSGTGACPYGRQSIGTTNGGLRGLPWLENSSVT